MNSKTAQGALSTIMYPHTLQLFLGILERALGHASARVVKLAVSIPSRRTSHLNLLKIRDWSYIIKLLQKEQR
jgi:hypothetical protein